MTVGKETFEREEVQKVARFSSAILQLCQQVAASEGRQMPWASMAHSL